MSHPQPLPPACPYTADPHHRWARTHDGREASPPPPGLHGLVPAPSGPQTGLHKYSPGEGNTAIKHHRQLPTEQVSIPGWLFTETHTLSLQPYRPSRFPPRHCQALMCLLGHHRTNCTALKAQRGADHPGSESHVPSMLFRAQRGGLPTGQSQAAPALTVTLGLPKVPSHPPALLWLLGSWFSQASHGSGSGCRFGWLCSLQRAGCLLPALLHADVPANRDTITADN